VTNARGKNTRMGGSDPTFDGFQPPKPKWGRSRPPRAARGRVFAACLQRGKQIDYGVENSSEFRKEKISMAVLKAPPKQPKTTVVQLRLIWAGLA
jgi:hypothetical protein